MPLLKDPLSKINAAIMTPDPEVALTMRDGYVYPSIYEPSTYIAGKLGIKAGMLSVEVKLTKVIITKLDLAGVKGTNYWSLKNNGQLPLINGKYKLTKQLGGKKVGTVSDGFLMTPNETIDVKTNWSLSWADIFNIIMTALTRGRVDYKTYGTVSALGLNQNINKKTAVPISK